MEAPPPALNLSPSERLTLRCIAEGEFPVTVLDWIAIQRLKQMGLVEDRGRGAGLTEPGRRELQRILPSSGA